MQHIDFKKHDYTFFKNNIYKYMFLMKLGFGKTGRAKKGIKNTLVCCFSEHDTSHTRLQEIIKDEMRIKDIGADKFWKFYKDLLTIVRENLEKEDIFISIFDTGTTLVFTKNILYYNYANLEKLYLSVIE